jgi:hypothetical protein
MSTTVPSGSIPPAHATEEPSPVTAPAPVPVPAAPEPAPSYLPALFADAAGALDLDSLRTLADGLRPALIDALRSSVRDLRAARGTVVTPEDTYDAVRRLVDAGEVLRRLRDAFEGAAVEADALVAEEAVIANGEQDGVPNGSLFVPDGAGQRICVRNDWANGKDAWDVGSLVGWLIEDEVSDYMATGEITETDLEDDLRQVARNAVDRLLSLGRFTPSVTAIEGLRRRHAERQDDATAALLRQLRTKGERIYKGVKITREDTPASQRGDN